MFVVEDQPNFAIFYVKSVSKLESVLKPEELEIVMDMLKIVIKKSIKNLSETFKTNLMGQLLFIEAEDSQYLIANEKTGLV